MAMCYPTTTDWGCVGTPEEIAALDPVIKARSEMLAWNSLARLTGFRLALCPTTVRPCATRCNPGIWYTASVSGWDGFSPYMRDGIWYNACGCRPNGCSCTTIQELVLPDPEVSGPVVVMIDGSVLDPSAYRVDNGNRLVRQDGGSWPLCQDMNAPVYAPPVFEPYTITWPTGEEVVLTREGDVVTATVSPQQGAVRMFTDTQSIPEPFRPQGQVYFDINVDASEPKWSVGVYENQGGTEVYADIQLYSVGESVGPYSPNPAVVQWVAPPVEPVAQDSTFTVSYYAGVGPDDALNFAAGRLAGEWYKACMGSECRLPSSATRVTRQGVTFEIPSFDSGTSGLVEVDNIVANYNPHHLKTRSRVLSPDSLRGRTRTA